MVIFIYIPIQRVSSVGVEAASVTALPVATQSIQPPSSRPRSFTTIADHYNYIVSFSLSPRPSHGTAFHTRTHANLRIAALQPPLLSRTLHLAILLHCHRVHGTGVSALPSIQHKHIHE